MVLRSWFTIVINKKPDQRPLITLLSVLLISILSEAKDLQPQITFDKGKIEIISAKTKTKKVIFVEFAQTEVQQQKGLMYREKLPDDEGMLFLFDYERTLGFWMKNTYIDLDIAYIDKNFKIVDIQLMKSTTPLQVEIPSYPSKKPAQFALEMNKNWFHKHKFKVGDQITIIKKH